MASAAPLASVGDHGCRAWRAAHFGRTGFAADLELSVKFRKGTEATTGGPHVHITAPGRDRARYRVATYDAASSSTQLSHQSAMSHPPLTPEPPASESVALQVRTDQLQLLFRQSFLATFGSVGGAMALSWLQRDLGNSGVIAPWLITLFLAGMVRLALFWAYNRSAPQHRTPVRWEGVYWTTLVFTAGAWGIGAFLLMSRDNLLSQAITLFFAVGMAGSAISAYSAYRSMTLVAVALVLLPTTLWLLTEPGNEQRVLALVTLAFASFVVRATRELSNELQSLLRLSRELEIEHRIASKAARTDVLTGLNNLRAFKEQADTMFDHTQRYSL